jgi:hypothetical protein
MPRSGRWENRQGGGGRFLPPHYRRRGVPTAAHGSAVQFTLLAASGMIGNQRLEHSGEPRGKSFGSDTLGGNAGALAQQEHFVGETLGIGELGIATQANKPLAERGFIFADDTPLRMIRVRQLDRGVGEGTAALGLGRACGPTASSRSRGGRYAFKKRELRRRLELAARRAGQPPARLHRMAEARGVFRLGDPHDLQH